MNLIKSIFKTVVNKVRSSILVMTATFLVAFGLIVYIAYIYPWIYGLFLLCAIIVIFYIESSSIVKDYKDKNNNKNQY